MRFDFRKVPVVQKVMGNQGHRPGAPMYQITDIGRKRLHNMAESGPELHVLQILAMKSYPVSAFEILNDAQGQIDTSTLRVAMNRLLNKSCVQRAT